jgi:hypothetical protein
MPGKLLFVLALATVCTAQNAPKPDKPMITPNLDGTFTVQKQPKDAKAKGLTVKPQVVVPFATKKPADKTLKKR